MAENGCKIHDKRDLFGYPPEFQVFVTCFVFIFIFSGWLVEELDVTIDSNDKIPLFFDENLDHRERTWREAVHSEVSVQQTGRQLNPDKSVTKKINGLV